MEIAIGANDYEYLRQVMIGCYRNNLDGYKVFSYTLQSMVGDYVSDESRLLKTAEEFEELAKKAKGVLQATYYKKAANIRIDAKAANQSRARIIQALDELKTAKIKFPDVFE